jgi:hypothetical protein
MATSTFLSRTLLLDAIATGATALLLLAAGGLLAGVLGLPQPLLRYAGLLLIPFVALVAWAGTRERAPGHVVRTVIGANAVWVIASILLLLGGWVQPTALGYAFVIGQAVVVGVFAELQLMGLRRSPVIGGVRHSRGRTAAPR